MNLKSILDRGERLTVPGVFDGLSASIAATQGFQALYMSGFAVAGSLLGRPDIGLVTATEMADRAEQIVNAARGLPVIADGDNGYGGELNVARLVASYESRGVQAVQLEDQVNPKRCGHMDGKQIVPMNEAVTKIRSAAESRQDKNFLIIARTDARATDGLDEALRRGEAFLQAGADILFIEAPQSVDEMVKIGQQFKGTPLIANMVEDGKSPDLDPAALQEMGFQILLRPVSALLCIAQTLQSAYSSLAQDARLAPEIERFRFAQFNQFLGLDELRAFAEKLQRN